MCSGTEDWAFLMMMDVALLVVPTGAVKFVMELGETMTGATPGPISEMVRGAAVASCTMLSVAVLLPAAVGVKVTEKVQFMPAGRDDGAVGQVEVTAKSSGSAPMIVAEAMFSGTLCRLVSVLVCAGSAVPSVCASKVIPVCESLTGEIPVPVRLTDTAGIEDVLFRVTEPACAPSAVGVKVMPIMQLPPAGTVAGDTAQVVLVELIENPPDRPVIEVMVVGTV